VIQLDEFTAPGGLEVVARWMSSLHSPATGDDVWTALDDRLRLALAQGWVFGKLGRIDEDLAEDLAADDSDNQMFGEMLADLISHWRVVYQGLRGDFGLYNQPILVGAGMELVVATGPEHIGPVSAGEAIPAHCFITRLDCPRTLKMRMSTSFPVRT
jgi:hypothetical protein